MAQEKKTTQLASLARLLLLLGGILMLLGGLAPFLDLNVPFDLTPDIRGIGGVLDNRPDAVVGLIVGILALIGSAQVTSPAWNIILFILGIVVGSFGGILIFIGGLIGLVAIYAK